MFKKNTVKKICFYINSNNNIFSNISWAPQNVGPGKMPDVPPLEPALLIVYNQYNNINYKE